MIYRSNYLTLFVVLFGALLLSAGFNVHLYQKVQSLENNLQANSWVSPLEFEKIKQELFRLDNIDYNKNKVYNIKGE